MTSNHIRLLSLAAFASMASMRMADPMLASWAHDFSTTAGQASHVIAGFATAYGVMQWVYGPLGMRIAKAQLVTWAAALSACLSVFTALAANLDLLMLARCAMGAVAAGIIPMCMALIGDQVPYEQRQTTLARLMTGTVTGLMAGQWLGGFASEYMSWRWAFAMLGVLFATAAWLLFRSGLYRAPNTVPVMALPWSEQMSHLQLILKKRQVQLVLFLTLLEGGLAFGGMVFVPSVLMRDYQLNAATAGSIMLLYGLGGLGYTHFAKRWIHAVGEAGLARLGGGLIGLGLCVLLVGQQTLVAMLGCGITGMGLYMLHNVLQTQATQMAPEDRSTALTLFASVLFLGQSLGVALLAWGLDAGLLHHHLAGIAVCIAWVGWWVARQSPQPSVRT